MGRKALSDLIRMEWPSIVAASRCHDSAMEALPDGPLHILGSSQKTEAGEGIGILTGVAYLAPAESSGRNVCPWRTDACTRGCLGEHAGRMGFDPGVKRAQLWKTALRLGWREGFDALVRHNIVALVGRATRLGLQPAVRLDGTSDLGDAERFADEFGGVVFYDYTKSAARAERILRRGGNQHATLSFSGVNLEACLRFLGAGGTVAVPFDIRKGDPIPASWHGFPCVNGDAHDYRPADPPGHVVALSWKGPKRTRDEARALGWLQ